MGFFKRSKKTLSSLGDGKIIDLVNVPDEAFASKALGDGVAIKLKGNVVHSPAKGVISIIFNTKHAFVIHTEDDLDILVHIGIDTVNLKGEGFNALVSQGEKVEKGAPIMEFNQEFIEDKGLNTTVILVVTNMEKIKEMKSINIDKEVKLEENILEYSTV